MNVLNTTMFCNTQEVKKIFDDIYPIPNKTILYKISVQFYSRHDL